MQRQAKGEGLMEQRVDMTLVDARARVAQYERQVVATSQQGAQRSESAQSFSHTAVALARHRRNAALMHRLM